MKDNIPLISIGLPVYNGAQYICEALDSYLSQDYENFELIISDNASTDNTWEIVQQYTQQDPRIILYKQTENIGPIKNFRFVLDKAQGEYFLWAAHDDYVSNNYLSTLVNLLSQDEFLGLAVSKIINIDPDGGPIEEKHCKEKYNNLQGWKKIRGFLKNHCTSWIYGIFRTHSLKKSFSIFSSKILNSIACTDRLLLYNYILNNAIVVTNDTAFYSRCKPSNIHSGYRPKTPVAYLLWALEISRRTFSLLLRAKLSWYYKVRLIPFFTQHLWKMYFPRNLTELLSKPRRR